MIGHNVPQWKNLEDLSVEEVMEQFEVTREQIAAVLDFVAQSLKVSAREQPSAPFDALFLDHGAPKGLARELPGHLAGRKIAVVVLTGCTKWLRIRMYLERIAVVVNAATTGSYSEIDIPFG